DDLVTGVQTCALPIYFIDGSARGLPPSGNTFYQMKSRDSFCPIGPYIVTADEIPDPHRLQVKLWVNGDLKQNYNTSDMAHKIPRSEERRVGTEWRAGR